MKTTYIAQLRNKYTSTAEFRTASDALARIMCIETCSKLPHEEVAIETPVAATITQHLSCDAMIVPILRSGLALVSSFTEVLSGVPIGMIGAERNEKTAEAHVYYKKLPAQLPSIAIVLDPMLATGGSAALTIAVLMDLGYAPERVFFTGIIGSIEGVDRLAGIIPRQNITLAVIDPVLNAQKYIVPGLGDYGDRYFGTH